ncbi:ATP-binding protein [Kitasatospora sp. NPDC048540]|uniref:ATP-binding protein n=1 Tax=Kitasatospora sp. NPDC048540 TaxID=3155634 RepID=UPI0033CB2EC1
MADRGIDPDRPLTDAAEPSSVLELADRRIPPRYRLAVADHPDVATWVQQVTLACRPGPGGTPGIAQGPSLLIAGPTGSGKTHQAYGAIRSLLAAGVRLRWAKLTATELYAAQRPRQGVDTEREMRELMTCPLLVLDDLGAAKASEWTEELTLRLVNHRYEYMLPTLFTTNLPLGEIKAALGDRTASRLAEMCERAILTGTDRRRRTTA